MLGLAAENLAEILARPAGRAGDSGARHGAPALRHQLLDREPGDLSVRLAARFRRLDGEIDVAHRPPRRIVDQSGPGRSVVLDDLRPGDEARPCIH